MSKHLTPELLIFGAALLALFIFGTLIMCSGLQDVEEETVVDTGDTATRIIFPQHPIALAKRDVLV